MIRFFRLVVNGALRMDHFSPDYWNMHDKKISDPNARTPTRKPKSHATISVSLEKKFLLICPGAIARLREMPTHLVIAQLACQVEVDVQQQMFNFVKRQIQPGCLRGPRYCFLTNSLVYPVTDANVRRISGIDAAVSSLNRAELPLVHGKEPIPTLEEVFQAFPNTPINLDLKEADTEMLEKVYQLIVRYDRRHITIWGSGFRTAEFDKLVFEKDPNIYRYFTMRRVMWLYVTHWLCLLPFLSIHESALEIPLITERLLRYPFPNASPKRLSIASWIAQHLLLSKSLFSHLKKRGVSIILWTPNTHEEFEQAMRAGVDGIMTDYPLLLRQWYDARDKIETAQM
ncbi:glycerophosphodiester phosphodiesterase domain-containing protein 1-like [Planoprotostelium fungivorum]|uniref:Glycerophosphodiester phosphodiesterase domain-containing protein 1-like n=1 Tax=Planoprotostelium fungivorum TaxID=1890364 RepID=A0A2P6NWE8_9EUKA|nr:glycerophosphodiester phosphodiesterase domain-containing protein 1-like [Planoprotostelium fungivorum]